MKLKEIRLKNFRCYEDLTVPLHENLTVLVAPNGQGKTTILDAITTLFSPYIYTLLNQYKSPLYINESSIRLIPDERQKQTGQYIPMMIQLPCLLYAKTTKELDWYLSLENLEQKQFHIQGNVNSNVEIDKLLDIALNITHNSQSISNSIETLPLFAFYGVNRGLGKKVFPFHSSQKSPTENTRFFAYHECTMNESNYDNAFNWFISLYDKLKAEAFERLEQGLTLNLNELSSEFTSIIQEIVNIILSPVGWSKIRTQTQTYSRHSQIVLTHKQIGSLEYWQLSEGIRSVLGMVMDIAYRCCILNSHLGENAIKETEGIVLIDEVDMHLHPEWQQVILRDLRKAFPNLQFIVTTHSPQVLTTVPAECIRIIREQKIESTPAGTKGAESSRLLERIFKVESRPPQDENTKMLAEYRQLVYADKWADERAKELRKKLDDIFQGNEPELTALDLYIDNHEWELSLEENQ